MKTLILAIFAVSSASAADLADHIACARASAALNPGQNEIFSHDGFLFTMNRLQRGFRPARQGDSDLPTLWVIVDEKTYIHNLKAVPSTKGGNPDPFQEYRMEIDVPGKGVYCLDYRYRMAADSAKAPRKGPCNPAEPRPRNMVYVGKAELEELLVEGENVGASYMLQDLIEDNLFESGSRLESALKRLRGEREKKRSPSSFTRDEIRESMAVLHAFAWDACEPVARSSRYHSVRKRLDELSRRYLLGALETGVVTEQIPTDCLPLAN